MRKLYEAKCSNPACQYRGPEYGEDVGIGKFFDTNCPVCTGRMQRVVSFTFHRGMQEHYNMAVGKPVSNARGFSDELKRKSEEMTIRSGMEHNYEPIDYRDKDACGATDEGLDSTYKRLHDTGEQELKTKTIITP